ncbi:AMP-binding protein [Streptomyces sp. bgisy091]|uniref:AMP-binding protein n=1 Tax=Streptomyces sp. bgisy091 TaxID=3413778 RepID=UPI003D70681C
MTEPIPPASRYERLTDLLAPGGPGREAAFVRVHADGSHTRLTGAELADKAPAFGAALAAELSPGGGLAAGRRVVVACRDQLAFVTAFTGCLYAGLVPVPAPGAAHLHRGQLERLRGILGVASAAAVVTDTEDLRTPLADLPVPVLTVGELRNTAPHASPAVPASEAAYVQFTSGSVSAPQPVELTDRHVLAQLRQAAEAFAETPESVSVNWVPLHHDMGLVTSVLRPLGSGYLSVLLDPFDFVREPARWIRALTEWRATHTSAPDFGYALTARKASARGADLATLRVARSAGEPVRAATLRTFADAFADAGFDPKAFNPSYGLAEATLTVTACPTGRPPRILRADTALLARGAAVPASEDHRTRTTDIVSCGLPLRGTRIRVLDTDTAAPLPQGRVGEVWISGPQVSPTGKGLHVVDGEPGHRTGDMGFVHDGELHLLGRSRERFQVGGENFYSGEIEAAATAADSRLRDGRAAAFLAAPPGGDEPLPVVVAEHRGPVDPDDPALPEIAAAVVRAVGQRHGLGLRRVCIVPAGTLPVTTSGKIQRTRAQLRFEDGDLPFLHSFQRGTP